MEHKALACVVKDPAPLVHIYSVCLYYTSTDRTIMYIAYSPVDLPLPLNSRSHVFMESAVLGLWVPGSDEHYINA